MIDVESVRPAIPHVVVSFYRVHVPVDVAVEISSLPIVVLLLLVLVTNVSTTESAASTSSVATASTTSTSASISTAISSTSGSSSSAGVILMGILLLPVLLLPVLLLLDLWSYELLLRYKLLLWHLRWWWLVHDWWLLEGGSLLHICNLLLQLGVLHCQSLQLLGEGIVALGELLEGGSIGSIRCCIVDVNLLFIRVLYSSSVAQHECTGVHSLPDVVLFFPPNTKVMPRAIVVGERFPEAVLILHLLALEDE